MDNKFFHKIGYKLPTNHYVNHSLITLGLFILLLIMYSIVGVFISLATGAILFYWSRELAQWEIRGGKFEWRDVVYPHIFIFILALLLTIIF
jgi:hypothetical protein